VRIVGVEAEGAAAFARSFASPDRRPVPLATVNTIADGIAVKRPGTITYPLVSRYVDEVVTVADDAIAATILLFMERLKLVVEGAGAAAVAALLAGRIALDGEGPVAAV